MVPYPENILPNSHAAPSLQEKQKEVCILSPCTRTWITVLIRPRLQLQKHMRADSLNDKISHRPTPEKLLKEGVLHDDPRSPDEKYAEAIEEEYAKREGGA